MKRILGIAMVFGLVGLLTMIGCSKGKDEFVDFSKNEVVDLGKGIKLEMVLIPAGKFMMGAPKNEALLRADDEFQHEVTLTKPYFMGKYEVTQEQWFEIMRENPSWTKGLKLPVNDVSWDDCQKFIKKLNEKTNGGYRLPTEAEWEYACRAGTTTAFSFGDKIMAKDANYDIDIGVKKLVEVGTYRPNGFGLYDMHGNVFEWCNDWHGDYPEGSVKDPKGPADGGYRVLRGGSSKSFYYCVRSSYRNDWHSQTDRDMGNGFRLARTK